MGGDHIKSPEENMLKNSKKVVEGFIFMESANSPRTYWILPDLPGILDREDIHLDIFAEA